VPKITKQTLKKVQINGGQNASCIICFTTAT